MKNKDKQLKLTKTELENYALLVMKLGITDEGDWELDYKKAVNFFSNLADVLPEEVGAVLSPMDIEKISFERSHPDQVDTIAEAEENLFTAAGVSSLIFNNAKASSNALLLSIKADQAITYGIVKSIEGALNRYIQSLSYGKSFRMTFLDCSPYNRKEMGDQYLKAAQYGFPTLSYYCASQGLGQAEMDCMNFLEDDVLGLKDRFDPLRTSATMTSDDAGTSTSGTTSGNQEPEKETGRPESDAEDLTDAGETARETDDGDNDGV